MGGAELLIAIAHILTTETDVTEALRLVVREVVRFIGAETGAAYRVDPERRVLVPVAAYRVPKHTLEILTSAVVPIDEQGFRESVFSGGSVTSSDDVQNDPRFAYELFRRFPHRSGVIVPFHVGADVAGALYLVWWERAERVDLTKVSMLEAVGQQLALLLRAAWLRAEAERQRAERAPPRSATTVSSSTSRSESSARRPAGRSSTPIRRWSRC
jgi:GAF domain-containing protein